jgi:hypothetical protein
MERAGPPAHICCISAHEDPEAGFVTPVSESAEEKNSRVASENGEGYEDVEEEAHSPAMERAFREETIPFARHVAVGADDVFYEGRITEMC